METQTSLTLSQGGGLQGDTLATYQFIICEDYVLWTSVELMKENGFMSAKARSRKYPTRTITDSDYADDVALQSNTPTLAVSLLHSLERAADGIGLHVNADKTEYLCFNRRGNISTLNWRYLKLVDKFPYLGSRVSSTKNDISTWLAKAWTVIDRISVIWKSDLLDEIKCSFFPSSGRVNTSVWMHYMDADLAYREKAWRQLRKNAASFTEQVLEAASHKAAAVWTPTTYLENHP